MWFPVCTSFSAQLVGSKVGWHGREASQRRKKAAGIRQQRSKSQATAVFLSIISHIVYQPWGRLALTPRVGHSSLARFQESVPASHTAGKINSKKPHLWLHEAWGWGWISRYKPKLFACVQIHTMSNSKNININYGV